MAADDGLSRYDGTALVSLNALRQRGPRLPAVNGYRLLATPDGTRWFGTEAGLFRFGPEGTLTPLPAPADHTVEDLALASDGRCVWATQGNNYLRAYILAGHPPAPRYAAPPAATTCCLPPAASCGCGAPPLTTWATWPLMAACCTSGTPVAHQWPRAALAPHGRGWLLSARAAYRPAPPATGL